MSSILKWLMVTTLWTRLVAAFADSVVYDTETGNTYVNYVA
jgi:hypothetical protein